MEQKELLVEGQSKQIFQSGDADKIIVHYKDTATAYNEIKIANIANKGIINNQISAIIYRQLEQAGIKTHFIKALNKRDQLCLKVDIIPVEVIVRNVIAGSMSKRLGIPEGTKPSNVIYDLCYKNKQLGDPLINDHQAVALGLVTYPELEYMHGQTKRINEVLDEQPEIVSPKDPVMDIADGSVDFDNVSFKYKKKAKEYVLSGVDLHFKAGETIGILGGTGSAKSSLVQLIPRLYDVTEGSVKVGGRDVREYDIRALRDAVSIVLQKNVLFSGTVRDNLGWGDQKADDEMMWKALEEAGADEFLRKMPKGLDTDMGQGGVNFSGGQKQRLCIARALLKKPKILILDDSTSAVDTATEGKIRSELKKLTGITKIIIAQRISSVMNTDKIVILEDGRVHAAGTHEELIKNDPIYQEIYASQMKGGAEDGSTSDERQKA